MHFLYILHPISNYQILSSSGFYFLIGLIFFRNCCSNTACNRVHFQLVPKIHFYLIQVKLFLRMTLLCQISLSGFSIENATKRHKQYFVKNTNSGQLPTIHIRIYSKSTRFSTLNILVILNIKYVWYTRMMLQFYLTDHINSFILLQLKLKEHACLTSQEII